VCVCVFVCVCVCVLCVCMHIRVCACVCIPLSATDVVLRMRLSPLLMGEPMGVYTYMNRRTGREGGQECSGEAGEPRSSSSLLSAAFSLLAAVCCLLSAVCSLLSADRWQLS
jgi:hypothetical protein